MSRQPPFEFSAFKSPESPLLILKEALNVIHNEIKRGKNSLASVLSPPQALRPSLSHQIIWMWRGRGGRRQEKSGGESLAEWDEGRWKMIKHINGRQRTNPFRPCCSCGAPPPKKTVEEVWVHYCFDGWLALTGWPCDLHRGQRRAGGGERSVIRACMHFLLRPAL